MSASMAELIRQAMSDHRVIWEMGYDDEHFIARCKSCGYLGTELETWVHQANIASEVLAANGYGKLEEATVIHVHHDIEAHARSYNEGYDAAVTQGLADDPSLADDWFQDKIREARAGALQEAANAIEALRPEMGPGINITQYREGRNDAFVRAADVCTARAVTERGGE